MWSGLIFTEASRLSSARDAYAEPAHNGLHLAFLPVAVLRCNTWQTVVPHTLATVVLERGVEAASLGNGSRCS